MFAMTGIHIALLAIQIASNSISVCDLIHPENFLNRDVTITGLALFTMHGMFLLPDPCPRGQKEAVVILTPGMYGSPKVDFELDPKAPELLKPFAVGPVDYPKNACVTLTGQVFHKKNIRRRMFGGGPAGNGFGDRGVYRVALVLRSIEEIRPCSRPDDKKEKGE